MNLPHSINLLRLWMRRRKSHQHYIQFQMARAARIQQQLKPFLTPHHKKILDIGSHRGGYSIFFAKAGFHVTGLEPSADRVATSTAAGSLHKVNIHFMQGDARSMPFPDESFDIILLSNVIEHIPHTEKLLREIHRVMRKKALLYIQFPPFKGIFGGHIYGKFLPLPLHYLPEPLAKSLVRLLHLDSELDEIERITIERLMKLTSALGLQLKYLQSLPENWIHVPGLREYAPFCMAIFEKNQEII